MCLFREGQPFKETTDDVKRHTEHVISAKRIEHFSWKNENNLYYKRGPALIFRQNENNLTKELSEALKVLEFQPQTLDLGTVEATLTNGKIYLQYIVFFVKFKFSFTERSDGERRLSLRRNLWKNKKSWN